MRGMLSSIVRVIFITGPAGRIIEEVSADAVQVIFIANDVFIIIALPYRRAAGIAYLIDTFGGG